APLPAQERVAVAVFQPAWRLLAQHPQGHRRCREPFMIQEETEAQRRVAIILPTYNGARYLPEQLDSLLAQSHRDFVIVTRDDGSTDTSREVLARYAEEHPGFFHIVDSGGVNVGACAGF